MQSRQWLACIEAHIETWCVLCSCAQSSSSNTSTCRPVTCQDAFHKMLSQATHLHIIDNAICKLLSAVLGSSQLHTHTIVILLSNLILLSKRYQLMTCPV